MSESRLLCPDCARHALVVGPAIELPADASSDEIALQIVSCANCGCRALAVYEESRRGVLGAEATRHTGYRVPVATLSAIAGLIEQCPTPRKSDCRCPSHLALGVQTARGVWDGLKAHRIETSRSFSLAGD
ncbi:MAG: hypothetical protein HY243_15725 [Proteobacteria bacterium]|nr:hypothetical protein [Pseudomonadota bacterium]